MSALTSLESEVLRMLLSGSLDWLSTLREQAQKASVSSRDYTGVGFVTQFSVADEAPTIAGTPTFRFGDVSADISGLQHGAGFLLLVKDGKIDSLEGYSYDEPWPEEAQARDVYYSNRAQRNEVELEKSLSYSKTM